MPSVEIIGGALSTYTRAARVVCEEKGIPYEHKPARPHEPEVAAIHPFGKIPVMRHGDFELCESKAIATYLDLAFPGPRLFPTEPRHAALTEQWVSLVKSQLKDRPYGGQWDLGLRRRPQSRPLLKDVNSFDA